MTLAFLIAHPRLGTDNMLRTGETIVSVLARTARTSNWRLPRIAGALLVVAMTLGFMATDMLIAA